MCGEFKVQASRNFLIKEKEEANELLSAFESYHICVLEQATLLDADAKTEWSQIKYDITLTIFLAFFFSSFFSFVSSFQFYPFISFHVLNCNINSLNLEGSAFLFEILFSYFFHLQDFHFVMCNYDFALFLSLQPFCSILFYFRRVFCKLPHFFFFAWILWWDFAHSHHFGWNNY